MPFRTGDVCCVVDDNVVAGWLIVLLVVGVARSSFCARMCAAVKAECARSADIGKLMAAVNVYVMVVAVGRVIVKRVRDGVDGGCDCGAAIVVCSM